MVRLLALAAAAAGWVGALGVHPGAVAGAAATATATVQDLHRAAVIVDTGTQTKSVCVRFRETAISGAEALARAGVDPVFRAFPGKGAAVCALCGTGCPPDESCLTCDPDGRFWAYSRAPAGTSVLRPSPVGASSTEVRDGDVEGWRWARGGAPPFATVEEVCGESVPPAATTPSTGGPEPTSAPASPTSSLPGSVAASAPPRGPAPTPASPPAVSPASTVAGTTTVAPATSPSNDPVTPMTPAVGSAPTGGPQVAAAPRTGGETDAGNGWGSLAGFAALSAGLLAWAASARRRRTRA